MSATRSPSDGRKVARGRPVRAMSSRALRAVCELQRSFCRWGDPVLTRHARSRLALCLAELARRGELDPECGPGHSSANSTENNPPDPLQVDPK